MVIKRSLDGGVTWSPLGLFYSNSTVDAATVIGNAAPVQDSSTGRIWVPFCRNNEEVYISYSDDDGITWSNPVYHPELVLDGWKWVGLGPPGGIQLSSGRLLIPSYHTNKFKGDGCVSKGHTLISDDHGATWSIGSSSFGEPFMANECQAVELANGNILIAARTISTYRIQIISSDGGITFQAPTVVPHDYLQQTIEGCEGSIVRDPSTGALYFSNPNNDLLIRRNMTVFKSLDDGQSWIEFAAVDKGAVSYSSMQIYSSTSSSTELLLLYERSNTMQIVFDPDEIVLYKMKL